MSVQGVLRYIRERVQDATTTRKGVIKLAGDLGGTADSPSVRSLSPEVSVGLAGGGTGADLSATGPGALVQANAGDPVTVETLDPSRGGTGVDNGARTITIQTASANFVFTAGKTLTVSQSLILNGNSGATLWLNVNFTVGGNAGTLTFGAASKTLTVNESVILDGASGKTLTLTGSLTVGADTSITGGGTIALGGFTLTVPATGTAALLATANTFTANQSITGTLTTTSNIIASAGIIRAAGDGSAAAPSLQPGNDADTGFFRVASNTIGFATAGVEAGRITSGQHWLIGTTTDSGQVTIKAGSASTVGLLVDTAASPTADALRLDKNGTAMIRFDLDSQPAIKTQPYDNGTGLGSILELHPNTNALTPAAGVLRMYSKSGTSYFVWVDDTGDLRINTVAPTYANDTAGTVVGSQS